MAKSRATGYYMVKAVRVSGWFLLALVLVYIGTGYSVCGAYGGVFGRVIRTRVAEVLHRGLDLPLVFFVLVHTIAATYLAFRRWGWIRSRSRT